VKNNNISMSMHKFTTFFSNKVDEFFQIDFTAKLIIILEKLFIFGKKKFEPKISEKRHSGI